MVDKTEPVSPRAAEREKLRRTVRYFYDLQKLRIASGNRADDPESYRMVPDKKDPEKLKKVKKSVSRKQMDSALTNMLSSLQRNLKAEEEPNTLIKERPAPPTLEEEDRVYLQRQKHVLMSLEADTLDRVKELLNRHAIYAWLKEQKGCGPTLSGVIIAEIDITRSETVSQLWAYSGLHTNAESGLAVRRQRGVKANWNAFLKAKLVKVLAECFIKANSPWRLFYDNYKHRKANEQVRVCMLCNGSGEMSGEEGEEGAEHGAPAEGGKKKQMKTCTNCGGTGGPAPWGRGAAHRDAAAKRYMVKMFLQELWTRWRKLEGLPVTEPYAVAALGRTHGDHGGMGSNVNSRTGQQFQPAPRRNGQPHPQA